MKKSVPPKKRRHADEAKPARTGKGKTAETAALLVEIFGEAGIDALLGMVTGGTSAAAKLGSKGGKVLKYADDVGDLAKLNLDDTKNEIDYFNNIKYNELKEYLDYKKNNPKTTYSSYRKVKALDKIGIEGIKSIPPKTIDVSSLRFKDDHARRHGCLENDAKNFVENAKCSIKKKRWDGFGENYYSDEGAAYIDMETGYIKTAFFKEDFDPKHKKCWRY